MQRSDFSDDFRSAIISAGLCPPDEIPPGEWLRFPGANKPKGNRAGWCRLFDDGYGGCFGDYSTGLSEVWQSSSQDFTARSRPEYRKQLAHAKARAQFESCQRQENAARLAQEIWAASKSAEANYSYLLAKRIRPHSARQYNGKLTLPIYDIAGALVSLQFIFCNGEKRMLAGGRKKGCFIPVSPGVRPLSTVIVCEGFSTGATIAEDEESARVISAIDAGNLESVAVFAKSNWPDADLIIAGDDDRRTPGNPGAAKASAAARRTGARLAMPVWPAGAPEDLTDFNDLARWLADNQ